MNDELNMMRTFEALGPLVKNAVKSGQVVKPSCELTEPDPDIMCEYDVEIPMSEGFSVTANVYRSKSAAEKASRCPSSCARTLTTITSRLRWEKTPLGGAPQQYRLIPQAGKPVFSKQTSWESPDPNFWVPAGYAIVNMNLPGYANSDGPCTVFSEHPKQVLLRGHRVDSEATVVHRQGGAQRRQLPGDYPVSRRGLPGLRRTAPVPVLYFALGGLTDPYQDMWAYGGLQEYGFPAFWWTTEVKPALNGTQEDFIKSEGCIPTDFLKEHPLYDEWWREKAAKLEEITVPMLVCASFSDHSLHTMGSFRAFIKARSKHKWVYTHRTGKWDSYYSPEVQELTKNFMDCFLKDDSSSGFLDTPPVRLEVPPAWMRSMTSATRTNGPLPARPTGNST